MPHPSSGTQPENPDIPHTGPLVEAPCHSRLPDRSRMYHEQPVQFGIPVRFRSVLVSFRSVYVRLSVAVPVVGNKVLPQAGKPVAVDRAALFRHVERTLLVSPERSVPIAYVLCSYHILVEGFPVAIVVLSAVERAA